MKSWRMNCSLACREKNKSLQHFRMYNFLLAANTSINSIHKALIFFQEIRQNSNQHSKLLRRSSEKRKTDQQPGILLENQTFPQLLQHNHHDSALSDKSVAYEFKKRFATSFELRQATPAAFTEGCKRNGPGGL